MDDRPSGVAIGRPEFVWAKRLDRSSVGHGAGDRGYRSMCSTKDASGRNLPSLLTVSEPQYTPRSANVTRWCVPRRSMSRISNSSPVRIRTTTSPWRGTSAPPRIGHVELDGQLGDRRHVTVAGAPMAGLVEPRGAHGDRLVGLVGHHLLVRCGATF